MPFLPAAETARLPCQPCGALDAAPGCPAGAQTLQSRQYKAQAGRQCCLSHCQQLQRQRQ